MARSDHILQQIELIGYTTALLREGNGLALVAEPNVDIDPAKWGPRKGRQMVRIDGNDGDSRYWAACQLAVQCGPELREYAGSGRKPLHGRDR